MKILIVNDDGIHARGLHVLAEAMRMFGEVWVVAPEKPQNAVGRAITLHKPLRLQKIRRRVFALNGTPADCVILGLGELLQQEKPALLVSGINKGLNLGDDVANSGTVSAAMEGVSKGIPSMAISLDGMQRFHFRLAGLIAQRLATVVLEQGLPEETMLNVNVPHCMEPELKGMKVTSLCRSRYQDSTTEYTDPRGGKYYWIAGQQTSWRRGTYSDVEAIHHNMVSLTPLRLDMTQYSALKTLRQWEPSFTPLLLQKAGQKRT